MYQQPAFDHPLLKDHTIQVMCCLICSYSQSRFETNETHLWSHHCQSSLTALLLVTGEAWTISGWAYKENSRDSVSAQLDQQCPVGTVPIVRATTEDLLMARHIPRCPENHLGTIASPNSDDIPGQHVSEIYFKSDLIRVHCSTKQLATFSC